MRRVVGVERQRAPEEVGQEVVPELVVLAVVGDIAVLACARLRPEHDVRPGRSVRAVRARAREPGEVRTGRTAEPHVVAPGIDAEREAVADPLADLVGERPRALRALVDLEQVGPLLLRGPLRAVRSGNRRELEVALASTLVVETEGIAAQHAKTLPGEDLEAAWVVRVLLADQLDRDPAQAGIGEQPEVVTSLGVRGLVGQLAVLRQLHADPRNGIAPHVEYDAAHATARGGGVGRRLTRERERACGEREDGGERRQPASAKAVAVHERPLFYARTRRAPSDGGARTVAVP